MPPAPTRRARVDEKSIALERGGRSEFRRVEASGEGQSVVETGEGETGIDFAGFLRDFCADQSLPRSRHPHFLVYPNANQS